MNSTYRELTNFPMTAMAGLYRCLSRQFFRSGDWKSALAASDLPADIQETIRTLVQRTGLMRFEKYEITDELISHFADGHQRGKSWESLQETFGDTDVAAELFRTSKLRNRPMAIKAGKFTLWTMFSAGAGYIGLLAFFSNSSPSVTVDYHAEMNQTAASIPEDQRAWLVYRDMWTKYEIAEGGTKSYFSFIYAIDENRERTGLLIRPDDSQWPAAVEALKESADLLGALRRGSRLQHVGLALYSDRSRYSEEDFKALFPNKKYEDFKDGDKDSSFGASGFSDEANKLMARSTVSTLLPHVQSFRAIARLLNVDNRLAVIEGDPDRAVENIQAILGFARQQHNEPFLVSNVVANALVKMACADIEELVTEHSTFLSDEHLQNLSKMIEQYDGLSMPDLTGENHIYKDLIQRIFTDDGNGDGRLTPVGIEILTIMHSWQGEQSQWISKLPWYQQSSIGRTISGPAMMLTAPTRKEIEAMAKENLVDVEARFDTPWWEDDFADIDERHDEMAKDMEFGAAWQLMAPRLGQVRGSYQRTIGEIDAARLGIAVHRFHNKNKRWPQSMKELNFDAVPLDRVTGEPLRFLIRSDEKSTDKPKETLVIYSVGNDRDDDQGTVGEFACPMNYGLFERLEADADRSGDWVLWPIDRS